MICCVFCELINVQSCCVAAVIVRDLLADYSINKFIRLFLKSIIYTDRLICYVLSYLTILSKYLYLVPFKYNMSTMHILNLSAAVLCRYNMHVYSSKKSNLLTFAHDEILAALS